MDKAEALKIAGKYLSIIKSKYNVQNALLFGSFAKGTNHIDSDIDLAIVINNSNDIIDTQIELLKLRRKVDLRIEPHPFTSMDFNKNNPVVNEILKYGIVIEL
ncbi:MAG: nucleotidyltransferase domain-containing protein [Bacteroidota bacterium]|nr:nucleotidyltransferase domain-containing protein [Bacteroidota bacterium]